MKDMQLIKVWNYKHILCDTHSNIFLEIKYFELKNV